MSNADEDTLQATSIDVQYPVRLCSCKRGSHCEYGVCFYAPTAISLKEDRSWRTDVPALATFTVS